MVFPLACPLRLPFPHRIEAAGQQLNVCDERLTSHGRLAVYLEPAS